MDKDSIRRINAVAPTRVCDLGGWTDTWFAERGAILNIAVYPYVEVQLTISPFSGSGDRVTIAVENFDERYAIDPDDVTYNKHPLIEAAIESMGVPRDLAIAVNIYSEAPPGASMGTSAAVSVALIAALSRLSGRRMVPHEVAACAHAIEWERLKLQCGIQDQLASAYGGINYIDMPRFPHAVVSAVQIANSLWWELENRLAVVYIGRPHSSSETHRMVIDGMGDAAADDPRLEALRGIVPDAKQALFEGDFDAFGDCMNRNTQVQRELHKDLVCPAFEEVIAIGNEFGAAGCKVNGAGGDGGSVTILTDGDVARKRRMVRALHEHDYRVLPVYLSRQGIRVWEPPSR